MSDNSIKFLITSQDAGKRLDIALVKLLPSLSRSNLKKIIELKQVKVNNSIVDSASKKLKESDNIDVSLIFKNEIKILPSNIKLNTVYEDKDILIINKPAGMVVHPGHGNYNGTLINALIFHFDNLPNNSSNRPGLVHRIDKDTSGLLVVAKTEEAMTHLAKQFFNKSSEREYIALVWGDVKDEEGTIKGNIGRHPKNRLQNTVFEDDTENKGKPAVTHYKVIERLGYVSLLSCKLETGRTHQIRVHLKYIGHTLFNDERYGGDKILKGTTFSKYKQFVDNCFKVLPRQALHARTLGFKHPTTEKMMRFDSPIPEDIEKCIEKWQKYSINSTNQ